METQGARGAKSDPIYSVVVPVFESSTSVRELVTRLAAVFEQQLTVSYEVILVDDGSFSPDTWTTCRRLADDSELVTAIRLTRNYGKPGAVLCGLEHARGRFVVTIDDDLQQRPEDIPALIEHQEHDVVVANFERRRHGRFTVAASWVKGHLDRIILGLPCRMSPLKLFKAEVAKAVLEVRTSHPFIPALLASVTKDFVAVVVPHEESSHGRSRYTLRRRVRQLSNLLISNSTLLLRGFGVFGVLVAVGGFGFAISVIARTLLGSPPLPGWASLVVINLVFGGLILVALSLMGEYLIRILDGVSNKPAYVVREIVTARVSNADVPALGERKKATPAAL